jgi:hypothetical protein
MACSNGLSSKTRGGPAPEDSSDASRPGDGAREAAEWLGVSNGGFQWRRWGKVFVRASGRSFYRSESLCTHRSSFQIHPPTESKIHQEFVADWIEFLFWFLLDSNS